MSVCGIGWMWFQHPHILVQMRHRAGWVLGMCLWVDVVSAPTHSSASGAQGWVGVGDVFVCGIGWMWFQHPHILVQVGHGAGWVLGMCLCVVQVRYRAGCGVLGGCWGCVCVELGGDGFNTHTLWCSRTGCGVLGGCWGCLCGIGWM